jgi:hypothetical protein
VTETVDDLLSDAFEDAWQKIQTSGNRLARPTYYYTSVMREVMAKHVLNLAQDGERDEITLVTAQINFSTTNTKLGRPSWHLSCGALAVRLITKVEVANGLETRSLAKGYG